CGFCRHPAGGCTAHPGRIRSQGDVGAGSRHGARRPDAGCGPVQIHQPAADGAAAQGAGAASPVVRGAKLGMGAAAAEQNAPTVIIPISQERPPIRREDAMDAVPRLDPRRGREIPPDFLVEQEPSRYTAQDHSTWRTLFARQTELLKGRVVPEYYA